MQVVHTKFIKAVLRDYSPFSSSNKMIWEQAAAAASQGKGGKNWELYGTLLAELRLEGEYNYKILITNDIWKLSRNISADKKRHT